MTRLLAGRPRGPQGVSGVRLSAAFDAAAGGSARRTGPAGRCRGRPLLRKSPVRLTSRSSGGSENHAVALAFQRVDGPVARPLGVAPVPVVSAGTVGGRLSGGAMARTRWHLAGWERSLCGGLPAAPRVDVADNGAFTSSTLSAKGSSIRSTRAPRNWAPRVPSRARWS